MHCNTYLFRWILTVLFSAVIGYSGYSEKQYTLDKRILLEEGLSQNRVTCIVEDDQGFMWFGTADGLNRYDGYNFKIFRNIVGDSTSLPNNSIQDIIKDYDGNLWIATNNGVSCFNPYNETFISSIELDSSLDAMGANVIFRVVVDTNNNIWCGTSGAGVFTINRNTFERKYVELKCKQVNFKVINALMVDNKNHLWVSVLGSEILLTYDIEQNTINHHCVTINGKHGNLRLNDIYQSVTGRIWVGLMDYTYMNGALLFYDPAKDSLVNVKDYIDSDFVNEYKDTFSIISSLTGDSDGTIYAASLMGGVISISDNFKTEVSYINGPGQDIGNLSVYYSSNDILWVGTNGKGVQLSVPRTADFKLLNYDVNPDFIIESMRSITEGDDLYWFGGYHGVVSASKDFSDLSYSFESNVYNITDCLTNPDYLWLGIEGGGLMKFNKRTRKSEHMTFEAVYEDRYLVNYTYKVFPVSDSMILLGTEGGLSGFNPKSNELFYFDQPIEDQENPWKMAVRTICYDNDSNILVGFNQGKIGVVHVSDTTVHEFEVIKQSGFSKNSDPVNCIYNDSVFYWIATSNGLYCVNIELNSTKRYSEKNGLPNSHIYAILPDNVNRLWMSTNNGITCFDPETDRFQNFDVSDGLQSNEFNTGAYYRANDGTLFFGGINGVNYFKPASIKYNTIPATVVLTGLKLGNEDVIPDRVLIEDRKLVVYPENNVFTIEFAGLSYINSFKNKYKYRIKQISEEWIDLGNSHKLSFNNMAHGDYTLEIIAANNHDVWTVVPYVLNIEVIPRFYETGYFYASLILIIIVIAVLLNKYRVVRIEKQREILQIKVEEQTKSLSHTNGILKNEIDEHKKTTSDLEASNETKDKFISIIAHDILNPVGVIQGFSELIADNHEDMSLEEIIEYNHNINITVRSLNALIYNLLQWSKLESKKIKPKPEIIMLKSQISSGLQLLTGLLSEKNINLVVNVDNSVEAFADSNMFYTIMRNLVSNAIKFTPTKGTIVVSAVTSDNKAIITVEDNGVGIPPDKIGSIFNNNGQYSTKGTNNESGTGLGLTLVHEFVLMNKGTIKVESEVNSGTLFTIELPASNISYESESGKNT